MDLGSEPPRLQAGPYRLVLLKKAVHGLQLALLPDVWFVEGEVFPTGLFG